MTAVDPEEASKVMDHFAACLEVLRLPKMVPHLMDERTEEGVAAQVTRKVLNVELMVASDWETYSEGYKRRIIWHEACHILHTDLTEAIWLALPEDHISVYDRIRIEQAMKDHCELMTQRMEQIGVEQGIIPPWPSRVTGSTVRSNDE